MTLQKVIDILESHNKWRRSDEELEMTDPKELGEAIDAAIIYLKTLDKLRAKTY